MSSTSSPPLLPLKSLKVVFELALSREDNVAQYSVGPQSEMNLCEFGSRRLLETRHGSFRAATVLRPIMRRYMDAM